MPRISSLCSFTKFFQAFSLTKSFIITFTSAPVSMTTLLSTPPISAIISKGPFRLASFTWILSREFTNGYTSPLQVEHVREMSCQSSSWQHALSFDIFCILTRFCSSFCSGHTVDSYNIGYWICLVSVFVFLRCTRSSAYIGLEYC